MQPKSSHPTRTPITLRPATDAKAAGNELLQAWVASPDAGAWILRCEDGRMLCARRAAACLLEPERGDSVLVFTSQSGSAFVLSVLEKASRNATLRLDGDLALDLPEGAFSLQAKDMRLQAERKLELEGGEVTLAGVRGLLRFVETKVHSLRLELHAKHVQSVCGHIHNAARSLVQHLRDHLRRVENVETLEAGRLRERIQETRQTLAGDVKLKARRRMKIDGERIDLG